MLLCKNNIMKLCCSLTICLALLLVYPAPPSACAASDITLPEGTIIVLQLNDRLSTKTSSEGDAFTAVVMTPVLLGDRMVIPKGSSVAGSISRILRPGRFKGKAVMNLLFQSITIPGHEQKPLLATLVKVDSEGNEDVYSEGSIKGEGSKSGDAVKVITPGLVGTGIGALAGGGKGAGIGAGVGIAVGLATVFTSRGKDIEIPKGSTLNISLDRPLTVSSEEENAAGRSR
jgi:hypothetical protein